MPEHHRRRAGPPREDETTALPSNLELREAHARGAEAVRRRPAADHADLRRPKTDGRNARGSREDLDTGNPEHHVLPGSHSERGRAATHWEAAPPPRPQLAQHEVYRRG